MQLIVVRESKNREVGTGLLREALSMAPLQGAIQEGLDHLWNCHRNADLAKRIGRRRPAESLWVLPRSWQGGLPVAPGPATFHDDSQSADLREWANQQRHPWVVIVNGRFAGHVNQHLVGRLLDTTDADCLAVMTAPDLLACREKLRLTRDNTVVGCRRLYADSMTPIPVPADWPHYLFVRRQALGIVLEKGLLSSFDAWAEGCRAAGLRLQSAAVAGSAYDLESEEGILCVSAVALRGLSGPCATAKPAGQWRGSASKEDCDVSPKAHLIGPVLVGRRVVVQAGVVVVGPTILCDDCTIGPDATIDSAVVGAGVSVASNETLRGCLVTTSRRRSTAADGVGRTSRALRGQVCPDSNGVFRSWPRLSYAGCIKRVVDVVAAVFVLILFAPVIAIIALAIKVSSPGPVFFRDKRQGLHGRHFFCAKFRTMRVGADKMQDKLRFVSEVDGPQFKMADDPRITTIGRFLRETYLDEIPQFFNVLRGQMSVVGPRPSPESENTLCPSWRDARLSVRPGITGLWQIYRTREPHKDFQEWIQYDTQYVRDFSLGLDLWICWRTFRRMVENFVSQF